MSDIAHSIRRFAEPPADQLEAFIKAGRHRSLKPGEPFSRLGDDAHNLAFIHSGIVRYFVILPDGEEATKDFSGPDSFTVSFGSAVMGAAIEVGISAITDCQLTVWPYRALVDLYDRHAQWERLGRRVAEMLYIRKEQRELSFLLKDAETRYREFMRIPYATQIPQYYIASYLGIRPQSLSRLRKRAAMHPSE